MASKKLEITAENATARGAYSNSFVLSTNKNEFVLDFIFQNYQQNLLQSRIIMTPEKAKELLTALKNQIEKANSENSPTKATLN